MRLVQSDALEKWERAYAAGTDKRYPSLELVRLEYWFFQHPEKGDLLEYAFGTGVNTIHLLECGYDVYGLDAAQGAVDLVSRKLEERQDISPLAHLSQIDPSAERLPFPDNHFDYLVAMSILSLLGSESAAKHLLDEFKRVLKPGGKAILDINDHDSEFSAGQEQVEENVFLFKGAEGNDKPVRCYCLPNEISFVKLIEPYFEVVDSGYSSHKVFGRRINEWIVCAVNS